MKRLIRKANNGVKIKQSLKDKVNRGLDQYNTKGADSYFEEIPLEPIFDVLGEYGLVAVQEDGTDWDGFLLGRNEKVTFDLVLVEDGERKAVENSVLSLSWYKFDETGRYEVVVYLT